MSNIPIPDPSDKTKRDLDDLEERLRREIFALRELHQTKLDALAALIDHDTRAQKEAAAKSEVAIGAELQALDRRVEDVKEQLTTREGMFRGAGDTRSERRQEIGGTVAIVGVILGAISILISVIVVFIAFPHPAQAPIIATPLGAVK